MLVHVLHLLSRSEALMPRHIAASSCQKQPAPHRMAPEAWKRKASSRMAVPFTSHDLIQQVLSFLGLGKAWQGGLFEDAQLIEAPEFMPPLHGGA